MNIAIAYSPNWQRFINIEIRALINSGNEQVTIYLLTDKLTPEFLELDKFYIGHCVYINMNYFYDKYIGQNPNVDGRFTKYTLYRLLIPYAINDDKVLYLDADTLVNGDISNFYNTDMNNYVIAGAKDIGILQSQLEAVGLTKDSTYINAGVLLMNLKEIRAQRLHELWVDLINSKFYSCHDQDVINMTCQGKTKLISNVYNASISTGQPDNPKIIHYAGPQDRKPWTYKNLKYYDVWAKWEKEYDT